MDQQIAAGIAERNAGGINPILLENKAKYNAKPTHTLEELLRLHDLLPDFMKLFLVRVGEEPVAGSLLFLANDRVALIFYHMLRYAFDDYKPIYLLMDRVTRWSKRKAITLSISAFRRTRAMKTQ